MKRPKKFIAQQTHCMAFTRLQVATQSFTIGKVDITERHADLTNGIISTKTVVVEHLHVQSFSRQFGKRVTYNRAFKQNWLQIFSFVS